MLNLSRTQITDAGLQSLALQAPHLKALSELGLYGTQITDAGLQSLALQAPHLTALSHLSLAVTQITDAGLQSLALQAPHLTALSHLSLAVTQITDAGLQSLAAVADQLPNLRFLSISGTAVTIDDAIKNSSDARAILKYVRELQKPQARPLGEFKLLLVGQGMVGKTQLRKSIFEPDANRLYHEPSEERTHDADCCLWKPPISSDTPSPPQIARVWDFGGQNELHSTHRFFLGGQRCFYLLVLRIDRPANGDQDDSNRLSYWLRMIAHYGKDSTGQRAPVLIVLSQCDRRAFQQDAENAFQRLQDALNQARDQDWYGANVVADPIEGFGWSTGLPYDQKDKIENQHKQAIEKIKEEIRNHLHKVPLINDAIPPNFFEVKQFVETVFPAWDRKNDQGVLPYFNRLHHSKFRQCCDKHEIDDGSIKLYLSILKSIGLVHWVGDVPEIETGENAAMKHMVFNPEWVRRPVYELIRAGASGEAGILDTSLLHQKLPIRKQGTTQAEFLYRRLQFGEDDRTHIVALMVACRLAFKHGTIGHLIPDFLDVVPVDQSERERDNWTGDTVQVWHLQADYLPEKVFLRFVADNYKRIKRPTKECFRNEVQLKEKVEDQSIPVLVYPSYSPAEGEKPYLAIHIQCADQSIGEKITYALQHEISKIYEKEALNVRLTCNKQGEPSPRTQPPATSDGLGPNVFRKQGDMWQIRYENSSYYYFEDIKGFEYLHKILSCKKPGGIRVDELRHNGKKMDDNSLYGYRDGSKPQKIGGEINNIANGINGRITLVHNKILDKKFKKLYDHIIATIVMEKGYYRYTELGSTKWDLA